MTVWPIARRKDPTHKPHAPIVTRHTMPQSPTPGYITSLIRHFEDLRDGTHGGSESREDKETHFEKAVQLLAPIPRQVLGSEHILVARHRTAHPVGVTAHTGRRTERILGLEPA